MLCAVLTVIGVYIAARALYGIYRIVEEIYILKEFNLIERYGKGSWAAITGCTDGIGLEFAIQLAKRGFNIVMLARNREKMNEKEELIKRANPNVQVMKLLIDFQQSGDETKLERIVEQLKEVDVSVLVNNVGIGTDNTPLLDMDMQRALDMIVVNCIPQTVLTQLFMPKFEQRAFKSAIVDLSSVASLISFPGKEIYSATKYFNKSLSNSFSMITTPGKIDFIALKPGFVTTPLTHNRPEDFITCNTAECVNGTLKALGHKRETFGSTKHVLFGAFLELFSFVVPFHILFKYRDFLYSIVKYKAFDNAKIAK